MEIRVGTDTKVLALLEVWEVKEGEGITEEHKERAVKAFVSKGLNLIGEEKGQQNYSETV